MDGDSAAGARKEAKGAAGTVPGESGRKRALRLTAPALALLLLFFLSSLSCSLSCSAGEKEPSFRAAVIGFSPGSPYPERNELVQYGLARVEAELGVEGDLYLVESLEECGDLLSDGGYDLVVSFDRELSLQLLASVSPGGDTQVVLLDYSYPVPEADRDKACEVRYRVEEGAYVCGFLAGLLTSRPGHPMVNSARVVAFIGSLDDPSEAYYDVGFDRGVQEAGTGCLNLRFYLEDSRDGEEAASYAEEAVKHGADIIFLTPGPFNEEVLEVARERDCLVILAGTDRYGEAPSNVLTSLVLRDDNALFDAVQLAMRGNLGNGGETWGKGEGTWSLAPFYTHDPYIRSDLKELLRQKEEESVSVDFSS